VYSKRVPHIWLILTLLTLFSFQRTPLWFRNHRQLYILSCRYQLVNIYFWNYLSAYGFRHFSSAFIILSYQYL